ncbi:MAG: hypothetical protein ILO68_02800, partial [Clostridia bacterium]|nr:hypothetical protein [Clostridia bacterium]
MKKRIQKIWSTLSRDIFVGERLERNLQNIGFTAVVVMVMGIVMTVLNVLQKQYATSLSPLVMFVAGLISFIAVRKFKRETLPSP